MAVGSVIKWEWPKRAVAVALDAGRNLQGWGWNMVGRDGQGSREGLAWVRAPCLTHTAHLRSSLALGFTARLCPGPRPSLCPCSLLHASVQEPHASASGCPGNGSDNPTPAVPGTQASLPYALRTPSVHAVVQHTCARMSLMMSDDSAWPRPSTRRSRSSFTCGCKRQEQRRAGHRNSATLRMMFPGTCNK